MKKLVVLLGLAMFVATSAFAIVDPDDNSMGMYWDLSADTVCMEYLPGPTNLYIILTNPTMDSIGGYECAYDMAPVGGGAPYILSATQSVVNHLDVAPGFQNFIVGFGGPLTCTEATLLVTLSVGNFAGASACDFFLRNADPSSIDGNMYPIVLNADNSYTVVGPSGGDGVTAAFGVTCGVVDTEEVSFDSVKSLFR